MSAPFRSDALALARMHRCPATAAEATRCSSGLECSLSARQCARHRREVSGDAGASLAPLLDAVEIESWSSRGAGRRAEVSVPRGACELLYSDGERVPELWARVGAPRASYAYFGGAAPSGRATLHGDASGGGESWIDGLYLGALGSLARPDLEERERLRAARAAGGAGALLGAQRGRDGE